MKFKILRMEVFSLIPVSIMDSMITMSKAEIRATVEEISGRKLTPHQVANLPGIEGPSHFQKFFDGPEALTDKE